jgi:hypothetical protein
LRELRREFGTDQTGSENGRPFEILVGGSAKDRDEVARWEEAGVTTLFVRPWARSREAVEGLRRFADLMFD